MRASARAGCGLVMVSLLAACAPAGEETTEVLEAAPGGAATVHAAYVLLAAASDGSTEAFARVITEPGDACPELVDPRLGGSPTALPTTPRDNPHGFAVQVCEGRYPFGQVLAVGSSGVMLPAVDASATPSRVVVLGDTGCKPNDQDGCPAAGSDAWPLPTFAAAAAADPPDLVLHMGDYNYRGTSIHTMAKNESGECVRTGTYNYDAGDGAPLASLCGHEATYYSQNSSTSCDRDAWPAWRDDFFAPARELLAAAPWVFARGNHELCSRAGPGFLYFLGPSSSLAGGSQVACPDQEETSPPDVDLASHVVFVPPYTVELGELAVSVLDDANACDFQPSFVDVYRRQLVELLGQSSAATRWIMMHRPIWGVDGTATAAGFDCSGGQTGPTPEYAVESVTLQCALTGSIERITGPDPASAFDLGLAGHMHRFEWLDWATGDRPPMLIVGNSGVELNADAPTPPDATIDQLVFGERATGFGLDSYGYVELLRDPASGSWSGQVVALEPADWTGLLPTCGSGQGSGFLCVRPLAPMAVAAGG